MSFFLEIGNINVNLGLNLFVIKLISVCSSGIVLLLLPSGDEQTNEDEKLFRYLSVYSIDIYRRDNERIRKL